MGSGYFGEPNMGNERGGSSPSSSSSRKGKKSSSEKPKQPQRGLGVAQLEKIRLHGQLGCNYQPSFHTPYPTHFNQEDLRMQTAYPSIPSSSSFSYSSASSPSSNSYGYLPKITMGLGDYERSTIMYGDGQPTSTTTTSSWNPGSGIMDNQQFAHPSMSRQLLNLNLEDPQQRTRTKKHRSNSMGSSSQNSESSDTQEVDLELRLSL